MLTSRDVTVADVTHVLFLFLCTGVVSVDDVSEAKLSPSDVPQLAPRIQRRADDVCNAQCAYHTPTSHNATESNSFQLLHLHF